MLPSIQHALYRIQAEEAGEVAISYCLIAALISVSALLAMIELGDSLPPVFQFVADELTEGLERVGL